MKASDLETLVGEFRNLSLDLELEIFDTCGEHTLFTTNEMSCMQGFEGQQKNSLSGFGLGINLF